MKRIKTAVLTLLLSCAAAGAEPVKPEMAIKKFEAFLSDFSSKNFRENTQKVYSPEAYFNDTLKEIHGSAAIEAYLIKTADGIESAQVKILDVASHGEEHYFRWQMDIQLKKYRKGETFSSTGISHIRFNSDGQVVYHQDYWDSGSNLFQHVPALGWMIRRIKSHL